MAAWKSYAFLLNGCFSSSLPPTAAVRDSDTLSSHLKAFYTCLFSSTLFILWNYHGVITKYIKTLKYVNIYYKNVTLHVYNIIRKEKIHFYPTITKISNKTSFLKKKNLHFSKEDPQVSPNVSLFVLFQFSSQVNAPQSHLSKLDAFWYQGWLWGAHTQAGTHSVLRPRRCSLDLRDEHCLNGSVADIVNFLV